MGRTGIAGPRNASKSNPPRSWASLITVVAAPRNQTPLGPRFVPQSSKPFLSPLVAFAKS